jgi:hypothetical protein
MRLWNPSGQREQTANFPKRDPTRTTLQTVSGQHYEAAGADTAPTVGKAPFDTRELGSKSLVSDMS